eukprot:TRINITY_DN11513_c0_g4_i1.p1 TRINITY_DN11513_c0_g4~~TRINITY_DN11513_c0_g4_i1.p1  ORF type:complete len:476 (+),score=37.91 TRINITY_DN11513_c0_g4_i1:144-1571(+)
MEFERSLFRVYQHMLLCRPLQTASYRAERLFPWLFCVVAGAFVWMHGTYTGRACCLDPLLRHTVLWNATGQNWDVSDDTSLSIQVVEDEAVLAFYRFVVDPEILMLRPGLSQTHGFEAINVSLPLSCLAPSEPLRIALRHLDGALNAVVATELAYTLHGRGILASVAPPPSAPDRVREEARVIDDEDVRSRGIRRVLAWSADRVTPSGFLATLSYKIFVLARSVIACFLLSSGTGLFLRTAVSCSAALIFVISTTRDTLTNAPRFLRRTRAWSLVRSFPWVGLHSEVLSHNGRSPQPLYKARVSFLVLQAFIYISCTVSWHILLFRPTTPEDFTEGVFNIYFLVEFFNLIFVRTPQAVVFFPKLVTGCVIMLHFYTYYELCPFYGLALSVCSVAVAWAMVFSINHFEAPARHADPFSLMTPTAAHPRSAYLLQLSSTWALEGAPLWTMFFPPSFPESLPAAATRHLADEELGMAL